jgi:hypothetical protein
MKIEMVGNIVAGLIAASAFLFMAIVLRDDESDRD